LLRRHLGIEATEIHRLSGGVFSRAYAAGAGGRGYVVRLSVHDHAAESFAKDDYAARHFASPDLPIPRIVARGTHGDDHYAIGERAAGRTLDQLSPSARLALLPAVLDMFDAITQADIAASRGYGYWDADGVGAHGSWRDDLAAVMDDRDEGLFQNWHALFTTTFLEREVHEAVYQYFLTLLDACPEDRALIHNDFSFENVLADGERISAVIDWGNALFGDPLYDVARFVWWATLPGLWYDGVADLLRARYGSAPNYAQRIACYQCHFGLYKLRYYAWAGKRPEYDLNRDRLLALISRPPNA